MTAWPEVVWDAAILRPLDLRARREIEAAGRLRPFARGDVVHRPGEPADALRLVVSGRFSLHAVRRGEAEPQLLRHAGPGELFGEEGTVVAFGVRQAEARCDEAGVVVDIPVALFERALGRLGGGEVAARQERSLRRAATMDLLRTTSFTRELPERDLEILLDAVRHVHVARGEHVYRTGEPSSAAYLVADGLLQAQSEDDGAPRVEAYLSRGDLFGEAELDDRSNRSLSVVASGPTWVVSIPRDVFLVVAKKHPAALRAARRLETSSLPARLPGGALTTAHVFQDLYRMRVARSMLVIDQSACVRCGHCAWSCANVHDDGISRLVRHGDQIVACRNEKVATGNEPIALPISGGEVPLLVPNSCQHCKNPSCMIDCPTGAIGRDARGEVFIREDLCTGCGSCAKACPWDNIAMAARPGSSRSSGSSKSTSPSPYPDVAVKCDLCSGLAGGPACVSSCPTEAIHRIDPNDSLVQLRLTKVSTKRASEVRPPPPPLLPPRIAGWPSGVGAALVAVGLALTPMTRLTSGIAAGAAIVLLAGYAAVKRTPRVGSRLRSGFKVARVAYIAHLAIGVVGLGAAIAHAPRLVGNAAGALTLALIVAAASGLVGVLTHVFVPKRLSRLERKSVLPEELPARAAELEAKLFATLSGKGELVKTLYAKTLRPYQRARFGAIALVLSGRSLRDEERRVRGRLDALLGEKRTSDRAAGLDDLVRAVVERRAVRAQRLLGALLRSWVAPHVAASAVVLVLLAVHVIQIVRAR